MLAKPLIADAVTMALQLEAEGIQLQLRSHGPLHDLVDAATPIRVYSDDPKGRPEGMMPETVIHGNAPVQNQHTYMSSMSGFVEDVYCTVSSTYDDEHSKRIRALVDDIAPFVQSHMSFFRNTVRPEVTAMETAMQKFVDLATVPPAQQEFRVNKFKLPELLNDETFLNMGLNATENAGEHDYLPSLSGSIGFAMPADLSVFADAVCNVGNARVTELVKAWRKNAMENVIERVFMANFLDSYVQAPQITTDRYGDPITDSNSPLNDYGFYAWKFREISGLDYLDVALAYFLIAQYLLNNPSAYKADVSTTEYKTTLQSHIGKAGHFVNHLLKKVKSCIAANVLVLSYDTVGKTVLVNDALLSKFLADGGTMELILGALVQDAKIMDGNLLIQKKSELLRAWDLYIQMSDSKARNGLLGNFVSFVRDYMAASMNEPVGLEKDYFDGNPGHKEKVMAMVEEHLRQKALESIRDIPEFALQVVAGYRFYYTEAYRFLKAMNEANTANPNIDAGEAAGMAELDYLVRYLCGMVNAVKVCA